MTSQGALIWRATRSRRIPSTGSIVIGLLLVLATCCVEISDAATTTASRQSAAAAPARSPGRLAPGTGSAARTVMHTAFQNAGTQAGLQIWRIENFEPVPYPQSDYGKFYTGDSYVVLYTKENRGQFSWDIHFWLGSQTSQDEAGAAAILAVELDDQLGGVPVQYREVQDHESQLFLSHFRGGVRYLPGGVASGFRHVDPNAFEKKLYQVKGKRNVRVKQVDLSISSMNKGDCFILDAGSEIFVYVGSESKRVERLKAVTAANNIRDQDHAGRGKVTIIDKFSSQVDVNSFFQELGSGSPSSVPDESTGGDDQEFERSEESHVALYRISDSSGQVTVEKVAQKPLKQEYLDKNDCFILDTGSSDIYVWIGKQCTNKEKGEAMNKAQQFLTNKHLPAWTHVQRVVEGGEPSIFKQYFSTWRDQNELRPRLIRSVGEGRVKTPHVEKSGGQAQEFMPDDGSGEVEIFRVENFELVPLETEKYGKFFGGDSYIVKYTYNNSRSYILYIWQGNESSLDEKGASAIHAVRLDNELGGRAIQIRVTQDNEPAHFLHIFRGKLITFMGGHASGFKNLKEHDTYNEDETRLFRVRGTNPDNVRASQLPAVAGSLQSDDVFILDSKNGTFVWYGKDANADERSLTTGFVDLLVPDASATTVDEGSEPPEFWEALGGQDSYNVNPQDKPSAVEPRLFHCSINKGSKFRVEEIVDYEQEDLNEDDVMILDTGVEIYIWIGKHASEIEKEKSHELAQDYLSKRTHNRQNGLILTVKQGDEPTSFTSFFPSWNEDLWDSSPSYEDLRKKFEGGN